MDKATVGTTAALDAAMEAAAVDKAAALREQEDGWERRLARAGAEHTTAVGQLEEGMKEACAAHTVALAQAAREAAATLTGLKEKHATALFRKHVFSFLNAF